MLLHMWKDALCQINLYSQDLESTTKLGWMAHASWRSYRRQRLWWKFCKKRMNAETCGPQQKPVEAR